MGVCKKKKKCETRITASVLKQDTNTYNAVYYDKTPHANFQGNPLYQVTKGVNPKKFA